MKSLGLTTSLALTLLAGTATAGAEEYRGIFWNMHSGDSSDPFLADQMVAKGDVDFWGLSEVDDQAALDTWVAALEAANPNAQYAATISEEGGSDLLAIIYRSDRLTAVPYTGGAAIDQLENHFFEVDSINVGGTIRPALGIQLQTPTGQQVVVLANHWKCCSGASNIERRRKQAVQMNAFADQTPGIPIISGGDFNIPFNFGGLNQDPFQTLMTTWEHRPAKGQDDVGTFRTGSVLDSVFVANEVLGWETSTTILDRDGNTPATSTGFFDSNETTDHRPILLTVTSTAGDRLDELEELIAELGATLERLKDELERLKAANNG